MKQVLKKSKMSSEVTPLYLTETSPPTLVLPKYVYYQSTNQLFK